MSTRPTRPIRLPKYPRLTGAVLAVTLTGCGAKTGLLEPDETGGTEGGAAAGAGGEGGTTTIPETTGAGGATQPTTTIGTGGASSETSTSTGGTSNAISFPEEQGVVIV